MQCSEITGKYFVFNRSGKKGRVTTIFKKEASLSSICSTVVRLNFHCTFDNVNYAITLLTGKKDSSRGPTVVETE